MLHTGYLYKMGDGPINYDWNRRYFVLDRDNKKLSYFLRETDKSARGHIDLSHATVSQMMPIKGRDYSFSIRENPKEKKEYHLSAEHRNDAEVWISIINLCTPKNDVPLWKAKKINIGEHTKIEDPELDRMDTEQKFPNTTDLFRKFKEKMTAPKKKGRKTEHVKKKRMTNLAQESPSLPPPPPPKVSPAAFGSIPDNFRHQLESIEKYLTNDDLFKLYKFDNSSRITVYQKDPPLSFNKKAKLHWIMTTLLFLFTQWLIGLVYAFSLT